MANTSPAMKQIHLSKEPMVLGVIAGIAEYFGWNVTLARLVYALVVLFTWFFPGIVFYFLAYFIIKYQSK